GSCRPDAFDGVPPNAGAFRDRPKTRRRPPTHASGSPGRPESSAPTRGPNRCPAPDSSSAREATYPLANAGDRGHSCCPNDRWQPLPVPAEIPSARAPRPVEGKGRRARKPVQQVGAPAMPTPSPAQPISAHTDTARSSRPPAPGKGPPAESPAPRPTVRSSAAKKVIGNP